MLLGQRELSEAQLRARLARRGCDPDAIDQALDRLKRDRTLDDGRVARAAARLEAGVRRREPKSFGSLAAVTGVFGLAAAGAVIQRLTGLAPRAHRVLSEAEEKRRRKR